MVFGRVELTNFLFILSHGAGFYNPTAPMAHPPISSITAQATTPGRL